jgi:hypothetical protein
MNVSYMNETNVRILPFPIFSLPRLNHFKNLLIILFNLAIDLFYSYPPAAPNHLWWKQHVQVAGERATAAGAIGEHIVLVTVLKIAREEHTGPGMITKCIVYISSPHTQPYTPTHLWIIALVPLWISIRSPGENGLLIEWRVQHGPVFYLASSGESTLLSTVLYLRSRRS